MAENSLITLHLRTRVTSGLTLGQADAIKEESVTWETRKTAILVCDMWDRHWCDGATERVDELAPAMDQVLSAARRKGVLIVHAPSDTMEHYQDFPQRLRAAHASRIVLPAWKARPGEPALPIDDSDGGCSTPYKQWQAWKSQHPAITIATEDSISDDGGEIYGLFDQCGIENVLLMGVHTNMCVLGRSFGLRRMVEMGKNAVLVRDLTDAMYNPARAPYVSHIQGTALVVAHIETYICPSMTSSDLTGDPAFRFREETESAL